MASNGKGGVQPQAGEPILTNSEPWSMVNPSGLTVRFEWTNGGITDRMSSRISYVWVIGFFLFFAINLNFGATDKVPEYDPAEWPSVHLKLSQAGTLKDVFDSGLRPYRLPGLETRTLEVKHMRLTVELASGKHLPTVLTEWLNIRMFDDGEIAHMEGATPRLSIEQARKDLLRWLPYGTRSIDELDSYLKAVQNDPLDFDDPYSGLSDGCAIRWKEPGWQTEGGGPQCTIWFRKAFSKVEPLRLYFKISWGANRPLRLRKSYRFPIPPPLGYEQVSMEAPKNYGPDSATDLMRSQMEDIIETPAEVRGKNQQSDLVLENGARKAHAVNSENSTGEAPGEVGSISSQWLAWGGIVLALLFLLLFFRLID